MPKPWHRTNLMLRQVHGLVHVPDASLFRQPGEARDDWFGELDGVVYLQRGVDAALSPLQPHDHCGKLGVHSN